MGKGLRVGKKGEGLEVKKKGRVKGVKKRRIKDGKRGEH